ncbi:MAG: hypothetical protein JRC92_00115 [Deltaproteobacteria bacterium]|nr:hypothetical protein [Deltaproteobacteria bacterium]
MSELTTLPGQIMHSTTADKILQPQEIAAETARVQANAATEALVETQKQTVQQTIAPEGKKVEKEEARSQRENEEEARGEDQEGEEAEAREGGREAEGSPVRLLDVIV